MSEPASAGSKPGIDRLLIDSALDANLRHRLLESPEETFQDFELTEEEKDLLRRPDHRLLRLLGTVLAQERASLAPPSQAPAAGAQPHAVIEAHMLPDVSMVLTVVPCAKFENGRLDTISYAVWVNPFPPNSDPASLPPPPGAVLQGQPLTPLNAVIQISALQMQDAAGNPQIGLTAFFRQASNMAAPPPPESAGRPDGSPLGGGQRTEAVQVAIAAVRGAPAGRRYDKLVDLIHALRGGEAR